LVPAARNTPEALEADEAALQTAFWDSGCLFFSEDGFLQTRAEVPPYSHVVFRPADQYAIQSDATVLFQNDMVVIIREGESVVRFINQAPHAYSLQPMWREIRETLKAVPQGVYEDPRHAKEPFQTLIVGETGLESRVKMPSYSTRQFHFACPLNQFSRTAILPIGHRCAARMLLHKIEYDGPCFPLDLARSIHISDVADMIRTGFDDMWNPRYLNYNFDDDRIYHAKWTGLSFAHEIEEGEDPINHIQPVLDRMRRRYSGRAARFWRSVNEADELLFVRTGMADRLGVQDLLYQLDRACQGKPLRLLLISPQDSREFDDLDRVIHVPEDFNPDLMYEDEEYWMHCAWQMREILYSLGISSHNLYWCPS
jgi:hypothetical protein